MKEALHEGTDLVSRRQRLIKFADWSEVDDSEDEKRVERAERMAEWKLAKRRKAATQETRGDKAEVSAAVLETGGSSTTEGSTTFACSYLMRAPFQPAMGLECHPLMLPVRPIKLDCPK